MNVKFFLVFALLVIIYEGGKMLNLPSLLIILAFVLLLLGVFIFFKFRIKVIEKEKMGQGVIQTTQLKLLILKSAYHDYQIYT